MIRAWAQKDIEAIAAIEQKSFADPWSKALLSDCLSYPYYRCFVAEEGGQVCGYCCLILLFEDGEVANIAVDSAFRGRGVAKALMEKMHEAAKAGGATRCLLEVRRSNAPAIALYEKFGYRVYGVRARYYGDEDALLMEKRL